MPIGSNIYEFDFTTQDSLELKVIMHFYVLRASMEDRVMGQLHVTDVVAVDRHQSMNLDPEDLQQPPKPYNFTGGDGGSSILGLSA